MDKNIFKILVLTIFLSFAYTLNAQSNPDGNKISLHLTPYTTMGEISGKELTPQFSVNAKLKIPVQSTLTIAPFFEYHSSEVMSLKYNSAFRDYSNVLEPMKLYNFGATISIYFK